MLANRVRMVTNKEEIYLAQDSDFTGYSSSTRYVGSETVFEIPKAQNGQIITQCSRMFENKTIDKIVYNHGNIVSCSGAFAGVTSNNVLDLSEFNVTPTNTVQMFDGVRAKELDLRGLDMSKVIYNDRGNMFRGCRATIGWARTQDDADILNDTYNIPEGLNFTIKEG